MSSSEVVESTHRLEAGRVAYGESDWKRAYRALKTVDEGKGLGPSDLELLSTTAYMLGNVPEMRDALERAYQGYLDQGDRLPAARVALWLASNIASRGKLAEASGWVERGARLLEPVDEPCVERGYLLLPTALRHIIAGEMDRVVAVATEAAEIGRHFKDPDLVALAVQTQSRGMLRKGQTVEAFRLLDEMMLSVIGGECSPMVTGVVYCSVVAGCYEIHEVRRAAEWTASLADWCGSQPDLVAFTDQCLAHRSEILKLQGSWADAVAEAARAHDKKAVGQVAAQAFYQQAEVHRLRGDGGLAEEAYRNVGLKGGDPQPGLALLRLAQGNHDAAVASISRALTETKGLLARVRLLPGFVEVMLAAGHLDDAREGAEEATIIADQTRIEMHRAWAAHSRGLVDLAEGQTHDAIPALRESMLHWQDLGLPYELARTRVDLARALRAAGDEEAAGVELEAARSAFSQLGARPDVLLVDHLGNPDDSETPHGLTQREVEVLRLLTSGATNRSIAAELVLSERTVDRHVSNIFTKLGVSSRSAATACAIRSEIV